MLNKSSFVRRMQYKKIDKRDQALEIIKIRRGLTCLTRTAAMRANAGQLLTSVQPLRLKYWIHRTPVCGYTATCKISRSPSTRYPKLTHANDITPTARPKHVIQKSIHLGAINFVQITLKCLVLSLIRTTKVIAHFVDFLLRINRPFLTLTIY